LSASLSKTDGPAKFAGRARQDDPLQAVEATPEFVDAIHALVAGKADPFQQRAVVRWLMLATAAHGLEFRSDRDLSAFASGKRWVGVQFLDVANSQIVEVKT
jgi:hypothetical protein